MPDYSLSDMIDRVKVSVVEISNDDGVGSGVVVDARGIIATNRHVVGRYRDVKVKTVAGGEMGGRVIRSDANVDYALVKADVSDAPPVPWNDDPVREGMTVIAIGHPLGYEFTVTKGIVSASRRVIRGVEYIQTDVPINPGNSGGPLLSIDGEVLGINSWIRGDAQNIGFAVPIRYLQRAIRQVEPFLDRLEEAFYCTACGNLNARKLKYCAGCGALTDKPPTPSNAEKRCAGCGAANPAHARFCKKCGSPLTT